MLLDQLKSDLTQAQKDKNEAKVSILRYVLSQISYAKINKGEELSDDEVTKEIAKEVKRHQESIKAFEDGNRSDLADKEKAELSILQSYLPEQLSEEELAKIVQDVITQTGATSVQDMGKVIGQVMAKVGSQAEGGTISRIVKEKLT